MKKEYWNVGDEQLIEKTGKTAHDWIDVLNEFDARNRKSNEVVAYLQENYSLPRYWARTVTTLYLKQDS